MQYDAPCGPVIRLSPSLSLTNFLSHQSSDIMLGIWQLYFNVPIFPLTFPTVTLKVKIDLHSSVKGKEIRIYFLRTVLTAVIISVITLHTILSKKLLLQFE